MLWAASDATEDSHVFARPLPHVGLFFLVIAAVFAANVAADVALRGTSDTDASNSVTTRAASFADLGDHIVRMKRCDRQGMGRCRQS